MTYHVMQDWTAMISHRQQGVIVLALRGPDGLTKESGCKNALRTFRACVMNCGESKRPLGVGESLVSQHDKFMRMDLIADSALWEQTVEEFIRDIDTYNVHFLQHFMHAAAVVGYNHPDIRIRAPWYQMYTRICRKIHVNPETKEEITHRLRDGLRTEEEELA